MTEKEGEWVKMQKRVWDSILSRWNVLRVLLGVEIAWRERESIITTCDPILQNQF